MTTVNQTAPLELSDNEKSNIANLIASTLVEKRIEPTVFQQPISFLRAEQDVGALFDFLNALPHSHFVRSRRAQEDYRNFARLCHELLGSLDVDDILFILGWASRLYNFYSMKAAPVFFENLRRIATLDGILSATQDLDFSKLFAPWESSLGGDTTAKLLENMQRLLGYLSEQRRVESISDRLVYLTEASSLLIETSALLGSAPENPDIKILREIVLRWNEVVQVELAGLRRSANPILSLVTNQIPRQEQVTIVVDLMNKGEGLARNVRVTMLEALGYSLRHWPRTKRVDPLPKGDSRQLEFTIEPRAATAIAQFEVVYDDLTGRDKYSQFSDELYFTSVATEFQRVKVNPYVVGPPVSPGPRAPFFGRMDLIDWIEEQLSGFQKSVLVLYGQRRTGKTSVLLQLERGPLGKRLREQKDRPSYPVYIDLQGLTDPGTGPFLLRIAETMTETLSKRGISLPAPHESSFVDTSMPYRAFNKFLDLMEKKVANGLVVLMLDEFEELESRVNDRKLDPDIFGQFRSQMQHRDGLTFILTGTHRLEEMSRDYQSMIFNVARHKEITFLSKDEATDLICSPVEPVVRYNDLAVDRIWRATHGHPYFIQLLCHDIISEMNLRRESNYVTATDVDEIIERLLRSDGQELRFLWDQSSPIEQEILAILATIVDSGRSYVMASELFDHFRQARVPSSDVDKALGRLVVRRILEMPSGGSTPAGSRTYVYCLDLFRAWVFHLHRARIDSSKFKL